uniref:Patatin-like phospholipase domain containing 8 n=1 Tax=Nothobranchius rachovii TaxID=451742 RepID=A0A1A8RD80_9TELE
MNHSWAPNTWLKLGRASFMWQTQPAVSLPMSGTFHCRIHAQQPGSCPGGHLSLRSFLHPRIRSRKSWILRANNVKLGLHTSSLYLKASASRWSAGLSQHMSRVKSTLDTVSKAVSGTHTDLLSKISRLRSNRLKAKKQTEVIAGVDAVETAVATLPSTSTTPKPIIETPAACPDSSSSAAAAHACAIPSTAPNGPIQVAVPASGLSVTEEKNIKLKLLALAVKTGSPKKSEELPTSTCDKESRSITPKDVPALFHPSTFSVNLDETYSSLAHHINSYFSSSTKAQDKKGDIVDSASSPHQQHTDLSDKTSPDVPAAQPSSKRSLGQYLSYSAPTVQAFVGNYIAPLVPKFRAGESKSVTLDEKMPEDKSAKQAEATVSKEMVAVEEKAKKLLLQREKIIARVSVDNRTRALVQALRRASDVRVYISRVEDLSYHLLEFPETHGVAVKEQVVPCLLRLEQANDPGLRAAVREALTLVGYQKPVKGRGVRILSIDGGGLRGLLALQTLHKLEALTGKPIYQLFDYICGVSTGAVIGFMLGLFQIPVKECDDLYRRLGSDVFKQNVIVGTMKMSWSHAFYDSEAWENILKEKMGSQLLVETSRNPECPKVAAVSTIVNRGLPLKAYVFRNYNQLPGVRSRYLGGCHHQLWQAIRATSAAPGYFQEFRLGNDLHQDGGLLINNPTALAIHECKCLWPNTPLECVVSLGTGRFETTGKNSATYTSLRTKLTNVISSATDTEEVHAMLDAFLPRDTYFRFNPFVNEDVSLDESRHEKLNLLQAEGVRYLERNEEKLNKVARILTQEKSSVQKMSDWAKLKADMYNGLSSKL